MYEAFDTFINVPTWFKQHLNDEERFYRALHKVVWLDDFNADQMAEHLRRKLNLSPDDHGSEFSLAVDRCQRNAWAVKEFLTCNRIPRPDEL